MAETTNKTTAPSKSSVKVNTYVLNNNNNNYVQVSANNTQISQPSGKKPKTLNWQEQRKLKRENRQEEEDRNTLASLESAIPQSNIGFKLLKQMGYTPGSTLGKEGSGLAEPVGLEIRRTRAGIGREDSRKEKRKREEERMEWERGKEEALMEDFGCRHKEQWRSRRIVVNYHKAKAALEQLENKEVVAEADKDEEDAENEEEEEEIITEERNIDTASSVDVNMNQWKHSYPTAWEQMKMTIERLFLITRICSTTQLPEEDATLPKLGMDRFVLDGSNLEIHELDVISDSYDHLHGALMNSDASVRPARRQCPSRCVLNIHSPLCQSIGVKGWLLSFKLLHIFGFYM
ncbi:unnamed protein product [Camellia sinensis]